MVLTPASLRGVDNDEAGPIMKLTIAGSAATVFALVALATAPLATASPEDEFLKALADNGISFPASMNPQVISAGHQVCADWASGASSSDEISQVSQASGLGNSQAIVAVRVATNAFCPNYASKI
jgi:hypothetical protein